MQINRFSCGFLPVSSIMILLHEIFIFFEFENLIKIDSFFNNYRKFSVTIYKIGCSLAPASNNWPILDVQLLISCFNWFTSHFKNYWSMPRKIQEIEDQAGQGPSLKRPRRTEFKITKLKLVKIRK